jgi:hypothetical protein
MPALRPLLVVFPTEHEAGALPWRAKGWVRQRSFTQGKLHFTPFDHAGCPMVQCICGMGRDAAIEAVQAGHAIVPEAFVLLAGYAGGLDAGLQRGDLVVSPSPFGIGAAPWREGECATVDEVVEGDVAREELRQKTRAIICDMEWQPLAQTCRDLGLPHGFLRSISDGVGSRLPHRALAAAYDQEQRRPDPLSLIGHLMKTPSDILPFIAFVGGLKKSQDRLRHGLEIWITLWENRPS